jgi:dTDP-4-amino-4,6-dideoxygalactose transaminase
MLGVNSRMDEIVAGFLLHRFANFDWLLSRRAEIAEYYNDRFAKLEEHIILPPRGQEGRCYYVYSIQTPKRDNLKKYLAERGIGSHVYYSRILPQQKAFTAYADPRFSLENAERASCQNLALPIYPHLTDSQVEAIADAVLEFFNV